MKITDWLIQKSTFPVVLVFTIIFFTFGVLVLPKESVRMEAFSHGAASPDTSLFYSPAMLEDMAAQYGSQGRAAYLSARWTFDVIFPLIYGGFLLVCIGWLLKHLYSKNSKAQLLVLFPVAAVGFDYFENIATSIVMAAYPTRVPIVAAIAPIFTAIKWILVGGSFLLLVALMSLLFYRKMISRK